MKTRLWQDIQLPHIPFCIMSTLADSEAQFAQRMKDLKVSESTQKKILDAGFTSFGVLAYAHGQPGQSIVDSTFEAWVSSNLDSAASFADVSCVKRFLFESQTLSLSVIKGTGNRIVIGVICEKAP